MLKDGIGEVSNLEMKWRTVPAYPPVEAGRLVGIHPRRVRRWHVGYSYRYGKGLRRQHPVLGTSTQPDSTHVSFLQLIELLFIKQFLDHGISLQRIRRALEEAKDILGTAHVAHHVFFSDGATVFLRVRDKGNAILQLLSSGQWAIAPIIEEIAKQIDFSDAPNQYARRWYPPGYDRTVVVDPAVSFGRPSLAGRRISTANIYDLFVAEGGDYGAVKGWWGISTEEVDAAVRFERALKERPA